MYMWSGRRAGNCLTECQEWNPIAPQKSQHCLPLRPVRMERHVYRISMIKAPAVMNRPLPKNRNRKRFLKRVLEKPLNLPGIGQDPGATTVKANHRRRTNEGASRKWFALRQLLFSLGFKQGVCNLRVGGSAATVYLGHFVLCL